MNGFITKTEVEQNKEFIVETWGLDFFNICMKSEGKTFLGILAEYGKIQLTSVNRMLKLKKLSTTL